MVEEEIPRSVEDRLAARVVECMLSREGTGPEWGIVIEDARAGFARISMLVRKTMTNGHGVVHGGMIFALADTAFAYACNSRNQAAVSSSASIVFLAPAREGDTLIAEAREEDRAGRVGVVRVRVTTGSGQIIAHYQGQSRTIGGFIIDEKQLGVEQ